ncbi:MBL fold metallo-hydrolase [Caproiciproducens sp.]
MIEKLFHNIYRIEIPLTGSPLKSLNCYFIRGTARNMLIDTGVNNAECRNELSRAMQVIGFTMENTDLFITHAHPDHMGLVGYLSKDSTTVYTCSYCAEILTGKNTRHETGYNEFLLHSGLADYGVRTDERPGFFGGLLESEFHNIKHIHTVHTGDVLQVDAMDLHVIETSGHASEHLCLYEPNQKIMFSGDHILEKISPNTIIWDEPANTRDYLGEYLNNLDKVSGLAVDMVLPGHGNAFSSYSHRIKELREHHLKRLKNILNILGSRTMTGVEVAKEIRWQSRARLWDDLPDYQKVLAVAETVAHLVHLVYIGKASMKLDNDIYSYTRIS